MPAAYVGRGRQDVDYENALVSSHVELPPATSSYGVSCTNQMQPVQGIEPGESGSHL